MKDVLLTSDGDLLINPVGDISINDSVQQAIAVRLRWFADEWRLGRDIGVPYFEEILIKNSDTSRIEQIVRNEILSVDEVDDVKSVACEVRPEIRTAFIRYEACVGETILRGGIEINAQWW